MKGCVMGKKGTAKPKPKVQCDLCGGLIAKNWMKRHLEEHKTKPLKFQPVRAVPKTSSHKVTTKLKAAADDYVGKDFSEKTKAEIYERDKGLCVSCGSSRVAAHHHIIFKSQGGRGHVHNGCLVCQVCHDWAHGLREGPFQQPSVEGREWFEKWRVNTLLPLYSLKVDPYAI